MAAALTRLQRAAQRGGEEGKLKQYLNAGDEVDALDADGNTALLFAVFSGHIHCVELLLAAGADPSISNSALCFPLYLAAQRGNITIARELLRAKADIDALVDARNSGTALFVAAFDGDRAMVRLLLDAGCDVSLKTTEGRHPLTVASLEGHTAVVAQLLDAGADVNAMSSDGAFALIAAAEIGSCEIVKILLDRGANVNQSRPYGSTALHSAARHGFDEVINVLIAAGGEVDQPDSSGFTPLREACYYGHAKCAFALLRAGANVSARHDEGGSPLHAAAFKGFTDVIEVLLAGGADVNLEDSWHRTPLISASKFADAKAVNLLLDAGADVNRLNGGKETALFAASNLDVVKALLDRGANAKVLNKNGASVLHSAGGRGLSAGVICALYRAGADPTVKAESGETAADLAREEGHEDAAKLLDLLAAKHASMNST